MNKASSSDSGRRLRDPRYSRVICLMKLFARLREFCASFVRAASGVGHVHFANVFKMCLQQSICKGKRTTEWSRPITDQKAVGTVTAKSSPVVAPWIAPARHLALEQQEFVVVCNGKQNKQLTSSGTRLQVDLAVAASPLLPLPLNKATRSNSGHRLPDPELKLAETVCFRFLPRRRLISPRSPRC